MLVSEHPMPLSTFFPYPGCALQSIPQNFYLISWWVVITREIYTAYMDPFFLRGKDSCVLCIRYERPSYLTTVVLITQLVIFFLMTIRKFWSDAKNIRRLSSQFKLNECFSPLFVAFVRDGTVFFLLYDFVPDSNTDCSVLQELQVGMFYKIRLSASGWSSSVVLLISTTFSLAVEGPLEQVPLV